MRCFFFFLAVFLPLIGISQHSSSLQDGLEAYDRGDYIKAYNDLLPHALKRNKIAQYKIGLLFLKGDGVEQSDSKAMEWLQHSSWQGYDPAMFELGLLNMEANKYWDALLWFDRIVGYQSILLYEPPSEIQLEAEEKIKEIYRKADLFPGQSPGWSAGETEILRKRLTPNKSVTIYFVIIAISYFSNTSGQEINLRIILNDYDTKKIIDALNGVEGSEMEEIRLKAENMGAKTYSFLDYKGYAFQDPSKNLFEKTIELHSEPTLNRIIKVFSNQDNEWIEHYLMKINLEKINETLRGHGVYFLE